ncbi:MAG: hypothetical protein O9309_01320 [Rhizobium sp.]|nr:hypothetical protein [Rhizobium sp.]
MVGERQPKGMAGGLAVRVEPADQPAIQHLLDLSDAVAARLYPGAFRQPSRRPRWRARASASFSPVTRPGGRWAARPWSTCPMAPRNSSA